MKAIFRGNQEDSRWRGWGLRLGASYGIEITKANWLAILFTLGRSRVIVKIDTWKGPALFGYRDQEEIEGDWQIINES